MYPFLNPDTDILTIIPILTQKLCVGDVVLAKAKSGYILHRLIAKSKYEWCRLQGDAHVRKEEIVYLTDIIGVLARIERVETGTYIDCSSTKWRLSGWCWMKLRFCRSILLRIFSWGKKIEKKIWGNTKTVAKKQQWKTS